MASKHHHNTSARSSSSTTPSHAPVHARRRLDPLHTISRDEVDAALSWLPLPPNPSNPKWKGRCFRCLAQGHSMDQCRGIIVCLFCHKQGHPSLACEVKKRAGKASMAALLPRGEPGDARLPAGRPKNVFCHLHSHHVLQQEIHHVQKVFIVDATHLPRHSINSINVDLQRALKWKVPFQLSHLAGNKYLLQFPYTDPMPELPSAAKSFLHHEGYMQYDWSPMVSSRELKFYFKVWLDIENLPPHL